MNRELTLFKRHPLERCQVAPCSKDFWSHLLLTLESPNLGSMTLSLLDPIAGDLEDVCRDSL